MVELRDYLSVLRAQWLFVLVVVFGSALLTTVIVPRIDDRPRASVIASVRIDTLTETKTPAVQYDGYYLIETERRFGDLLGQTLLRDDLAGAVSAAGASIGLVRRVSPLDYRVLLHGAENPTPAAAALREMLSPMLKDATSRSGEVVMLSATVSEPELLAPRWTPLRATVAGALLGLLAATSWILMHMYRGKSWSMDHES